MEPEVRYRTHKSPQPALSSPFLKFQLPENLLQYYPPIYAWVFQVVSFPQVSPPQHCIHLSLPSHALHAPLTLFFSI